VAVLKRISAVFFQAIKQIRQLIRRFLSTIYFSGEDRCEVRRIFLEIDSVRAIPEMERLGPQKPDDFSVLASHSFRMAGEEDRGGNNRRSASRDARSIRRMPVSRRILADALPITCSNKALIPTTRGAPEAKLIL
jgi:hypothetical protein